MTIVDGFQSSAAGAASPSEDVETAHGPDAPRHIVTAIALEFRDQSASAPAQTAESERRSFFPADSTKNVPSRSCPTTTRSLFPSGDAIFRCIRFFASSQT